MALINYGVQVTENFKCSVDGMEILFLTIQGFRDGLHLVLVALEVHGFLRGQK